MAVLIVALYYSVLSRIQERPTKNRQLPVEARACGRRTSTAEPLHRDRCACWDTELYFWDQWPNFGIDCGRALEGHGQHMLGRFSDV